MAKKKVGIIESNIPWVEKYRPKSIKDMAIPTARVEGHRVNLAENLSSFIKEFFIEIKRINEQNKKIRMHNRTASEKEQLEEETLAPEKAAVLLEGPPGVGKTSIVYALGNDLSMEVIETNASDTRTREALEIALRETTKTHGIMNFMTQTKEKLILIDEIDGIYGTKDRGAVPAILDLIQNTQFPILMCSNEYKQSLQSLYKKVRKFEIHPLSQEEMIKIAQEIIKKENITVIKNED